MTKTKGHESESRDLGGKVKFWEEEMSKTGKEVRMSRFHYTGV